MCCFFSIGRVFLEFLEMTQEASVCQKYEKMQFAISKVKKVSNPLNKGLFVNTFDVNTFENKL